MAYLILAVCVLILFGQSVQNILIQKYEVAAGYGFSGVALAAFYIYVIKPMEERRARDKVLEWIVENKNKIFDFGALYDGERITKDTMLIKYCIVYSVLIYTSKEYSNFCFKGSSRSYRIGIFSTIFSFFFGWWGFPMGLIYTPQALYENIFKTQSMSIGDLFENSEEDQAM